MKKYKMDRIDQIKEILADKKNVLIKNRISNILFTKQLHSKQP